MSTVVFRTDHQKALDAVTALQNKESLEDQITSLGEQLSTVADNINALTEQIDDILMQHPEVEHNDTVVIIAATGVFKIGPVGNGAIITPINDITYP